MTSGNEELLELLKRSGDDEAELDLKILSEELEGETLKKAVMRRASGEPLAYILGYRHFYKECYKVCPGVLIPRADTEILVESALKFLGLNVMATGDVLNVPEYSKEIADIRFADLCTGTGCIGISIANEIVRAGGNTLITFFFDSCFVWVINVPIAFCLSRYTYTPVYMMLLVIQATEIIKCVIGGLMVRSGIWAKNIVK